MILFSGIRNKYQIKFNYIMGLLLCSSFLISNTAHSQNFIEGINVYNNGQFDYMVSYFGPDFLKNHKTEKGLANYFIAESYYNLALEHTDIDSATNYFENAWSAFELAQSDYTLKRDYPEFYSFAQYKKAWCSFRLAEIGVEPQKQFEKAYGEFLTKTQVETPDSLTAFALIMAAESKLLQCSESFMEQLDNNAMPDQLDKVLKSYDTVKELYSQLLHLLDSTSFERSKSLKEVAILKKQLLNFSFSKIYQICAVGFDNTLKFEKKSNQNNFEQ